jgi:3-hydroxyacyl-CoA dehydrogenase
LIGEKCVSKNDLEAVVAVGASITDIDEAMLDLGTPMSPLRFADTSVAGRHNAPCALLKRMSESGGKFYAGS